MGLDPADGEERDDRVDRVLAPTRWAARIVIPVLVAAFVILYGFPQSTRALWAWTISPDMTAMAMGGGYLAGAWFFWRVATSSAWHEVGHGVLAVSFFASLLLVATLLHWDRFNHDHVSFWAWLALYVITPPLLPTLWWLNRRHDPRGPSPGERLLPRGLRAGLVAVGAFQGFVAVQLAVYPATANRWWPWQLTPLTSRTLAAFIAFPAVMFTCAAIDRRWSSFRIPFEVMTIGVVLYAVAALRAIGDFRSGVRLAAFFVGLAGAMAALVGTSFAMRKPTRAQ